MRMLRLSWRARVPIRCMSAWKTHEVTKNADVSSMSAVPSIQKMARTTKVIQLRAGSSVVILTFSFSLVLIFGVAIENGEACTAEPRHNNNIRRTKNMLQYWPLQFGKHTCRRSRS
jgi:hypothetical protein